MLEVRLLGQFDVRRDGTPIAIPSRPAQSLLACLLLNVGTAHRREKLAGLLWPDSPEETARGNLRKELWRLRKALASGRSSEKPYILADDISLAFNSSSDYWLDISTLDCGASSQATTDDLLKLLAHYRGELLPGFYDDWAVLERERLRAVFEQEVQRLLDCLKEEQRWPEVLDWGERWIALGSRPEPAYRALMIAHGALGDRSKVVSTFQRSIQALRDDLGVEPSELTYALYKELTGGSRPVVQTPPAMPWPVLDTGESLASSEASPSGTYAVAPFKGLQYFDETDAELFFGREELTAKLIERLRQSRFLAVFGASGSGKSSVVRAGLVPALKESRQLAEGSYPAKDSKRWRIQVITPTAHPLEALARTLTQGPEYSLTYASVLDALERDPYGLHLAVKRVTPNGLYLLLIVDQFEELFTLCRDEFEREAFVDNLLTAASIEAAGPTTVVLAVRADFYAHCAQYDDLRDAVAEHQEYIGPMSVEELRCAIEQPARRGGWEFEAGLVDLILRDVGDEPGGLPLLSHGLLETWNRRSGHTLTLKGYTDSGGVRGAISHTAEAIYQRLLPEQQEIARRVFLRLTELGEGTEDTRRRAARRELTMREQDAAAVQEVLGILAEARLVTLGEDTVEVAHEALIREWPRLREWLNQDRAGLRLQRQLTEAAQEWERLQREEGVLYRGVRLAQAAEWTETDSGELNAVERAFLDASIAERERQRAEEQARAAREARLEGRSRNILRVLVVVLLVATLGAFALTGVALNQSDSARRSATVAQSLALTSAAQLATSQGNSDLALALALAANRVDQPVAQAQLTLADLAYRPGLLQRYTGHTDAITGLVFSPDGKTALSASADQTLILWDVFTGKVIRRFEGHTQEVLGVAFNPDGKTALSSSADKTLILWDIATGQVIRRLEGHTGPVTCVTFSPDGKTALSSSADKTLILWDIATGQVIRHLEGHTGIVLSVTFSPDGKTALSSSADRTLILWDIATGNSIRRLEGHTDIVASASFSPDGKTALSSSFDHTLILWDVATAQILHRFQGHREAVNSVAFSRDGRTALSGGGNGNAWFSNTVERSMIWWDVATGQIIRRFEGHTGAVTAVAFSPDGHTALSGSRDNTLILWRLDSGAENYRLSGHQDSVKTVAFSPDGKTALSGGADGDLLLWDVASEQIIRRLNRPNGIVNAVAFSPDGHTALSGAEDGALTLWDLGTSLPIRRFYGHASAVTSLAISRDGKTALSGSLDRTLILWDVASGQLIRRFESHTNVVNSVALSPDGKRALSGSYDRTLILWDLATGLVIRRFPVQPSVVNAVAFNPHGEMSISGTADGNLILWDLESGNEIRRFSGHKGGITSVAFSSDGRTLLSGSVDQTLLLWDVASGQPIRRFEGHQDVVNAVAFSPDGREALSGSSDKTVRLWRIDSLAELIAWTKANRAVLDLPCEQRALYSLGPFCGAFPGKSHPAP